MVREHHAYPSFDEHGHPQNEEARIINEVIGDLVADQDIVTRVLEIHRGWYGLAMKEERKILLRMFRERRETAELTVTANQWNLYDIFQGIIHEIQHLLEAPEYGEYTESLPGDSARNTAGRGVRLGADRNGVGSRRELMSEVPGPDRHVRDLVEREYAQRESAARKRNAGSGRTQRYRSHAEAEDLIRLVGILNVLAAFLTGDMEKITGPGRGTPRSLLAPASTLRRTFSELSLPSRAESELPPAPPAPPPSPPSPTGEPPWIQKRRGRPVSASFSRPHTPQTSVSPRTSVRGRGPQRARLAHATSLPSLFTPPAPTGSSAATVQEFVEDRLRLEGRAADDAVMQLAAVLEEAAGRRVTGEQWRDQRHGQVRLGLGLLPLVTVAWAHTLEFPGIDPDQLPEGVFAVPDAVTGLAGPGDATTAGLLFVVDRPQARNLYGLPGQAPGTLMFAPGTRFVVVDDRVVDGRRTVTLRHPAAGEAAASAQQARPAASAEQARPPATAPLPPSAPPAPSGPPAPPAPSGPPAGETLVGMPAPTWVWLDVVRGIAIPDPAGDTPTNLADWRVAEPGEGRGYAVHLPTGMIAARLETGSGPQHVVNQITEGWVNYGRDLVHQTTHAVLRGQGAAIGMADTSQVLGVTDGILSRDPNVSQLDRQGLLRWLLDNHVLAGPVPGVVPGAGWQVTDETGDEWVWNGPGRTGNLPPGLHRGFAAGVGMLCLLDSLRQLLERLPAGQSRRMTVAQLRSELIRRLPPGNEARAELVAGQQVDVTVLLPEFTAMFEVRVQVFELTNVGIGVHPLQGPAVDQYDNPTPVLRLYWEGFREGARVGGHFEPLFPGTPSSATAPSEFGDVQDEIRLLLTLLDAPDAVAAILEQAEQIEAEAAAGTGFVPELTNRLTTLRDALAQMTDPAAPAPASRPPAPPPPVRPRVPAPSAFNEASFAPRGSSRAWVHHIEGDLLELPAVDAIVNAANNELLGTGGVSGEILRRGGTELRRELEEIRNGNQRAHGRPGIEAGEAVRTSAPHMVPHHIIHAVPPDFGTVGDTPETRALLANTYRSALALADSLRLDSVAFPILAGGIFRGQVPEEVVEQIALDTLVGAVTTSVRHIYLVRYQRGARATLPRESRATAATREEPVPSTVPPPLSGLEQSLAELEAARRRRVTDRRRLGERLRGDYGARVDALNVSAMPAQPGRVPGDCLYDAIIALFRNQRLAFMGRSPNSSALRMHFAERLRQDFALADGGGPEASQFAQFFPGTTAGPDATDAERQAVRSERARVLAFIRTPGRWADDMGDNTVGALARAYGLPMTVLGQDRPYDVGPEGPREAYVFYRPGHYTAGRPPAGPEILSATQLYQRPQDTPEWASWTAQPPAGSPELAAIERDFGTYRAGFEALRARFMPLYNASAQARDSREGRHGVQISADLQGLLDAPVRSLERQDRVGDLYERFRRVVEDLEGRVPRRPGPPHAWPGARQGVSADDGLDGFRRAAEQYLDAQLGPEGWQVWEREQAVSALAAVLAEAAGQSDLSVDETAHNVLVDFGLGFLPLAEDEIVHADSLPGWRADNLRERMVFDVAGPVTGRAGPGQVPTHGVLFVVDRPQARNLSVLPGVDQGTVMFAPGTRFEVVEKSQDGRMVRLRHPAAGEAAATAEQARPTASAEQARPPTTPAPPPSAPPAPPQPPLPLPPQPSPPVPPLVLEPGWDWLDQERGIKVPTFDRALTGGDETAREDWRAAVPGAGRGYAVHLPTGMIAAPVQDGDVTRYAVHPITDGWHYDGNDLVHRLTRAVLRGGAGAEIGSVGEDRWRRLFDQEQIQRQHPTPASLRAFRDQHRQLNREDLLRWLLGRGGLAGPVPGIVTGRGWQPVTEDGAARWVWNSPGEAALDLPRGLRIGQAAGHGMRCLLDSLRQVMPVLPGQRREDMTVDFLRDWLQTHLPVDNEAHGQLQNEQTVDVWSVLPALTAAFQVRVQLFTHAERESDWGSLLAVRPEMVHEWPGYETILPSDLVGPPVDQQGNQTPVLRLYWRGGHFVPVYDYGGPVSQLLAEIERLADGLPPEAAEAANGIREQARQLAGQGLSLAEGIPAGSFAEVVSELLQTHVTQLRIVRNHVADMTAPSGASGQRPALAPAPETQWGQRARLRRRAGGDEPPGISTQRLGGLDDALRLRVHLYLAGRFASQRQVDLLTDVLGEAEGEARGEPDEEWNQRISDGLALLPAYYGEQSFTAELPGITAELQQGDRITVPGLIRAHKKRESVTSDAVLYVIESPQGRDVSRLVGPGSDLVMFDRDQHFEVARVRAEESGRRRTIVLRPPTGRERGPDAAPLRSAATDPALPSAASLAPPWRASGATTADPGTSATRRHDASHRRVSYNDLTSAGSRALDVESPAVEESSASRAEDSSQNSRRRSIIFNTSPAPVRSWAAREPGRVLGGAARRLDSAVASYAEQVNEYLAAIPFSAGPQARQQLSAVLAEAGAQASGQPAMAGPAWHEIVDHGLTLLLPTRSQWGFAAALPDARPDRLTPGASFTIETPALAYISAESVPGGGYLFEIERPEAHDITRLAGDEPGRMMFAAGTPFVVKRISERGGRTVIRLAHHDVAALEASRLRRQQQPGQEPPAGPRTLERHREAYAAEFQALQERFQELASSPAAAQSAETVGRGRRAMEHFLGLTGAALSQGTVDSLGQQYASLREATRDLDDQFAGLPEEAVAVRRPDGAYMTSPSEIGLAGQMDLPLPQFFTARRELLPQAAATDAGWIFRPSGSSQPSAADAQVQSYLERNPSLAAGGRQQARERLAALLMEVRAQGFPEAADATPEWNALVAGGLDLLPPTASTEGYATVLPGPDPAVLAEGEEFSITGPALGYVFRESARSDSTLFVIDRPAARDVSWLTGDPFGRIMFAPGSRFVVVRVSDEGGRRVIYLSHRMSMEERYLTGSGLVLPEGMSWAEAVAALQRVAEQAGYRGAQAMPEPQADSLLRQGLRLLSGFAGLRVYASMPADHLTMLDGAGELTYQQGRVIQWAGLTLGLAEPGEMPAGQVRMVIYPRPAGGGSGARDAGWLLGAGLVVFGPGTRFEVAAVDDAHGELSLRELPDATAAVPVPEVAGQPVTAAPFGLARPDVMAGYADNISRLADVWEQLWEPERAYALQTAINAAVARIGVPLVQVTVAQAGRTPALFSAPSWEVLLAPGEMADLWYMALAVYREARRAEQMFLMMRLPAGHAHVPSLPAVVDALRQQGMLAAGSPEYAAARGWWDSLHGTGTETGAVEASVRGPLRQAVEEAERRLWEFEDGLSAELAQISDPQAREQRAQQALAPYDRDVATARDAYEHRVMRRYRDLPVEFDAFMLQARVQHGLNPGAVPVEDHHDPPAGRGASVAVLPRGVVPGASPVAGPAAQPGGGSAAAGPAGERGGDPRLGPRRTAGGGRRGGPGPGLLAARRCGGARPRCAPGCAGTGDRAGQAGVGTRRPGMGEPGHRCGVPR